MPCLDEDFAARLQEAPDPGLVIKELFEKAKSTSEGRFFCSIVDLERMTHDNKSYLVCQMIRQWVVQQFSEYFSRVTISTRDFPDPKDVDFVRRLHMLAYSQFWECLGVQRLLQQLVNIASGREYEPRLFLDERPQTYQLFRVLRKDAATASLKVSEFLTAVYSNQIRNAFAHSEFWIIGDYVTFQNHDFSKEHSIPSLKLATWDKLFTVTSNFIGALFSARREAESELEAKTPYKVSLDEFKGAFAFARDERGYWSAKSP
jgi:hypothetical protein